MYLHKGFLRFFYPGQPIPWRKDRTAGMLGKPPAVGRISDAPVAIKPPCRGSVKKTGGNGSWGWWTLARAASIIKENLFWAFSYNVVAIPLAVTGFIHPVMSAAFMSFSSLFVVTNSMRIRK